MIDSNVVLNIGQQRLRDLYAEAAVRRQIRHLDREQRPTRRSLLGQHLNLLVTLGR